MSSNRNIVKNVFTRPGLAAVVIGAACLFTAAAAGPAAADEGRRSWRDNDRHDHDHGRSRRDRDGHGHRHSHVVEYHVDGKQDFYVGDKHEARSLVRRLRSLGAEAHYRSGGGRYRIFFEMDGHLRERFDSHGEARRFARWLDRLGFHATVES